MKTTTFLKKQLIDFVEVYQKYLRLTLGITITYTIFCFVCIALLLQISNFGYRPDEQCVSILSYFFNRYSAGKIYTLVDLSKTVFLLFVSLFSLGLVRNQDKDTCEEELSNWNFFRKIKWNDLFTLGGVFLICVVFDFVITKLDFWVFTSIFEKTGNFYLNHVFIFLRIFVPLLIFGFSTIKLLYPNYCFSFKKLIFMLVAVWLFNEFFFEFTLLVRKYIFGLILMPLKPGQWFFIESVLGVPLIALSFLGYYSAMVNSVGQPESQSIKEDEK